MKTKISILLTVLIFAAGSLVFSAESEKKKEASEDKKKTSKGFDSGKGGAQLWAETCVRCHFIRPADAHTDAEWEIIMMQMRMMVSLTDEQYQKILAFLKSAN